MTEIAPRHAERDDASARSRVPAATLFAANAVSLVGSQLSLIAVPWFVLTTTGSAARVGLTAFVQTLAVGLAAFFGGAIVDRLGRRRASVVADLASGAVVAAIPTLYHTVGLPFAGLLGLVFLRSLFDTPGATARMAMIPDVAATAGLTLERANAGVQAVDRGARLLGAPLAGLLIGVVGPSRALWFDAITFATSATLVASLVPPTGTPSPRSDETYVGAVVAGLRFVWRDRLLRAIVVTVALSNVLESPIYGVVLPVYVRQAAGGAADLGGLIAVVGGGALLGALGFGAVGRRLPPRTAFVGAFVLLGLPYWVLALVPPLPTAAAALFVAGVAAGPINPIIHTVLQERIPLALRGRAFGAVTAVASAATPFGLLLAGPLVEWGGIRIAMLVIAGGFLVVTLGLLFVPAFRLLDRPALSEARVDGPPGPRL